MSDEVRALIAEARGWSDPVLSPLVPGRLAQTDLVAAVNSLVSRLADALEAAHAEPDDDEREALKQAVTHGYWERTGYRVTWEHIGPLMDAIFAHGFRRSARVLAEPDERAARFIAMATPIGYSAAMSVVEGMTRLIEAEDESRRSARVPVSRDELAEWLDAEADYVEFGAGERLAAVLQGRYDIYPKADRKPADSSNGDERG